MYARIEVEHFGCGNPLVSVAGSVALLSAMTGSASGGMSIALDALGRKFVDLAQSSGVSLDVMHRVTAIASGSLDALPHNGAGIRNVRRLVLAGRALTFFCYTNSVVKRGLADDVDRCRPAIVGRGRLLNQPMVCFDLTQKSPPSLPVNSFVAAVVPCGRHCSRQFPGRSANMLRVNA